MKAFFLWIWERRLPHYGSRRPVGSKKRISLDNHNICAMREKVEKVLNEKVRPQLELHNGDLDVLDIEDGVVRIRLLGQCAGCPSAYLTIEQLIFGELTVAIPEIRQVIVVQDVSDELWEEARAVMQGKYENH